MAKNVAVVGLGYVGLPLACLCAKKGHQVVGIDITEEKVNLINQGKSPIQDADLEKEVAAAKENLTASTDVGQVAHADVIVVCVPTPVDKDHHPNLDPLKEACASIVPHIKENALIVIESTIHPGTTEEVVLPILEKASNAFHLAHCPERIDPGNQKYTIENLPRVVAGTTEEATAIAAEFYQSIISAEITELSSVKAAEATKIMENTFRDINIAFINEMAMSFDKAGIDIIEVIRGASTKPFAFMPHFPGAGVGGHCIPVDPYYLIEKAKEMGFSHRFLSLAREINNNMPTYTVELLENELEKKGKKLSEVTVGVLGVAYKKNIDDQRESPAVQIIDQLKKSTTVEVFDPFIPDQSTVNDTKELLKKVDVIILATDHDEFANLETKEFKTNNISIVIDGKNCLDKEAIKQEGIAYHGIGRS